MEGYSRINVSDMTRLSYWHFSLQHGAEVLQGRIGSNDVSIANGEVLARKKLDQGILVG